MIGYLTERDACAKLFQTQHERRDKKRRISAQEEEEERSLRRLLDDLVCAHMNAAPARRLQRLFWLIAWC